MSEPINETDHALNEVPPGPTADQWRAEAAERGDVDVLLDFLLDAFSVEAWTLIDFGGMLKHFKRACEVRAQADPEGFDREFRGPIIGCLAPLFRRLRVLLHERAIARGTPPATPHPTAPPSEAVERVKVLLAEAQRSLAELLADQARADRPRDTALAKEARAGRAAASVLGRPRAVAPRK